MAPHFDTQLEKPVRLDPPLIASANVKTEAEAPLRSDMRSPLGNLDNDARNTSSAPSTSERGNFDRQRENMFAENRSLLQSAIWNSANQGNASADASPRKPDSPLISVPRISSEEWFHLFETTGLCQVMHFAGAV
jgi:hypothetical protein